MPEEIGLVILRLYRSARRKARFDGLRLARNDRGRPVLVGEAEPAAIALEGEHLAWVFFDAGISDLLHPAVADHPDEAFMQHRVACDVGLAATQDQRIGTQRNRIGPGVFDRIGNREHVMVVDRDDPPERQAGAIVPLQRHRFVGAESRRIRAPEGGAVRRFDAFRVGDEAAFGPIGRGAARRRKQRDVGALRIDRLAIRLEFEIVDQAPLEGDRTAERGRIDRHPRAEGERLGAGPGSRIGRRLGLRRRGAIYRRLCRTRRRRLALSRRRRVHPVLLELRGVEIVPADQHEHRKDDRQYEVAGILGIHDRPSLFLVSRTRSRLVATNLPKPSVDFADQGVEIHRQRRRARYQHVVMIGQRLKAGIAAQRLAQTPAYAIAHDRVADLLGHGEADTGPRRGGGFGPTIRQQRKGFELRASAPRGALKLGAPGQAPVFGAVRSPLPCRVVQGVRPARLGRGPRRPGANG
jgi:hypothetical protein